MPCEVEGCEKPRVARGLCGAHYRRNRLYGDPLAYAPGVDRVVGECSAEECGKPSVSKGMCGKHYEQLRKTFLGQCNFEGCQEQVSVRGWCSLHYSRWLRHGDPSNPGRWKTRKRDATATSRECSLCEEWKPVGDFYRGSKSKDGYSPRCKRCCKKTIAEAWEKNGGTEPSGESKACNLCGIVFPGNEFRVDRRRKDGRFSYCKDCASLRNRRYYTRKLARDFGVGEEVISYLRSITHCQNPGCGILLTDIVGTRGGGRGKGQNTGRVVDHDHDLTGIECLRGTVCESCNKGQFMDSVERLIGWVEYLKCPPFRDTELYALYSTLNGPQ